LAVVRGPNDVPLLLLYTMSGFGFGMRIAQLSAIPADVFAGPHLGAILGVVQAGGGLGGAVGPFVGGWLFDVTGSYRLAFMAARIRRVRADRLGPGARRDRAADAAHPRYLRARVDPRLLALGQHCDAAQPRRRPASPLQVRRLHGPLVEPLRRGGSLRGTGDV